MFIFFPRAKSVSIDVPREQFGASFLVENRAVAEQVTVFFYALFMDPEMLEARGFRPTNMSRAYVDGFALKLGARATLAPSHEARVYGTTMALTHAEIDRLYSEPSVSAY